MSNAKTLDLSDRKELPDYDDDIDYLHPDGKPKVSDCQKKTDDAERLKPVSRASIDEADGHHMCSEGCRRRHS